MYSVTQRIKAIKQPRGGYIKPKEFIVINVDSAEELKSNENIHANLVGLAVDYMTRFITGTPKENVFKISLRGAQMLGEENHARKLLDGIKAIDESSISNACKLSGYDVCVRAGVVGYSPVQNIAPDRETIANIKIMIMRSINFLKEYGPITMDGFTFQGGYTEIVSTGDGDYLTADTLWDFKVSKNAPTNAHTLQLLMYYIMGIHSIHEQFKGIKNLGIFNPRLNNVYLLDIRKIPEEIINQVSSDVIGY
jgi:hypothetical protein